MEAGGSGGLRQEEALDSSHSRRTQITMEERLSKARKWGQLPPNIAPASTGAMTNVWATNDKEAF